MLGTPLVAPALREALLRVLL